MSRPTRDEYFMAMARLVATRATCARRAVGCVLVDLRGHVLATGYNGVPGGFEHCIDVPCPGAGLTSGQGLDACEAVHAEMNALTQCRDVYEIETVYCTTAPCVSCAKALLSTSARRIVFAETYPQADAARGLWLRLRAPRISNKKMKSGEYVKNPYREWVQLTEPDAVAPAKERSFSTLSGEGYQSRTLYHTEEFAEEVGGIHLDHVRVDVTTPPPGSGYTKDYKIK